MPGKLTLVVVAKTGIVLGMTKRHEHPLLTADMTDLFAALSSHFAKSGTAEYSWSSWTAGVGTGAAVRLRMSPIVVVIVAM